MADEVFFVGIKNHVDVRKELLTSSKSVLDMLRRHEQYAAIKEEKQHLTSELKRVFDELLILNKKLKTKMPKVSSKSPALRFASEKPKPSRKHRKRDEYTPTKLDLLEQELAKVERRLSALK